MNKLFNGIFLTALLFSSCSEKPVVELPITTSSPKALEYYKSAVDIDMSDRNARIEYGRSLHHFGYTSEAIKQFEVALLQPIVPGETESEIALHINLLNALGDVGKQDQLEKTVRRADKLITDKYGKEDVPPVFTWNLGLGYLIGV